MIRLLRKPNAAAPLCLALLLLAIPAWGQEDEPQHPGLTEVIRELRVAEPRGHLDARELYQRSKGSTAALRFLFNILETRKVPAWEDQAAQTLSDAQATLILEAMANAPVSRLGQIRDQRIAEIKLENEATPADFPGASRAARAAAIQVTSIMGSAADIELMVDFAWMDGDARLTPKVERLFEDSLHRLLSAEPSTFIDLQLPAVDDRLVTPLLRALGRTGNPLALPLVEDALLWSPEHASAAAAQIRVLGPSYSREQNERLAQILVGELEPLEPGMCVPICQALGGLRSEQAIDALIGLLDFEASFTPDSSADSEQKRVRSIALWALREITARSFGPDSELWRRWLTEQRRWLRDEAPFWLTRLKSRDAGVVGEALRTLSKRRLGRVEIASAIAKVLETGPAKVAPLACHALGELGCQPTVPALLGALDSASSETQIAAWESLQRLTGLALPMDPVAWSQALPSEVLGRN